MLRLAVIICSFFCFDLPSLATAAEYELEDQSGLSGDFDKIAGSLSNWLIEKNEEMDGPFAEAMRASDQKTRVFFGTIVGVFLTLVLLFVVKLAINLVLMVEVIAFGAQNPNEPNALPDGSPNALGRAANRRVEVLASAAKTMPKSPEKDAEAK